MIGRQNSLLSSTRSLIATALISWQGKLARSVSDEATERTDGSPRLTSSKRKMPWNGEFYGSFGMGDGASRSWSEAVRYGFISAGGGNWYSNPLGLLKAGDRIWVKAPPHGFVGVARVAGLRVPAIEFHVETPDGYRPILDVLEAGTILKKFSGDPERTEYFVPVRWLHTVPLREAIKERGLFGNQNSVCRPTSMRWSHTVDRLKEVFTHFDN